RNEGDYSFLQHCNFRFVFVFKKINSTPNLIIFPEISPTSTPTIFPKISKKTQKRQRVLGFARSAFVW
ncbi:MAG: hypothetical protein MR843_00775, partial [Bacteroidales bacterium]|nr:hypothetical protein [Bacteroidales bacterium]